PPSLCEVCNFVVFHCGGAFGGGWARVGFISVCHQGQFPATRYAASPASVSLTYFFPRFSKLIWLYHRILEGGYESDTLDHHELHPMAVFRHSSDRVARIDRFSASCTIPRNQNVLLRRFFHAGRLWRCAGVLPGAGE